MENQKHPITIIKEGNSYQCLYSHNVPNYTDKISSKVKQLLISEEIFLQIKKSSLKKALKILENLYNQF